MDVNLFDFDLPEERIALRPAQPRDSARLLRVGDTLSDHVVTDLPNLLQPGDLLVLNQTKVLKTALKGVRAARPVGGGGPVTVDINFMNNPTLKPRRAFVRPAKRLKVGDVITFGEDFFATVSEKDGGIVTLDFNTRMNRDFFAGLNKHGAPPLPPYIAKQRPVDERDVDDYQTVYATNGVSVAAPTAGLHFTDDLFERLRQRGVKTTKLTLNVGAGTFLPVKSDSTDGHVMHSEAYCLYEENERLISETKASGGRVVAVGTTSLRALEASGGKWSTGSTDIFITPGYDFKVVDGLMTNFHLPRSTLFMLVSALAGLPRMQAAYAHAIASGYRFYSYGDSSLIWKA